MAAQFRAEDRDFGKAGAVGRLQIPGRRPAGKSGSRFARAGERSNYTDWFGPGMGSTGSTAAKTIIMTQKTGDVQADGDVTSTRIPDKKPQQTTGTMLSGDEPLQAKAARMTSKDNNQQIRYEGNALMWQGSNRIQADRIDIDRQTGRLQAQGNVVTQLLDTTETQKQKKGPVFTIVKAPQMLYLDKERVAHYQGGVVLNRGTMVVNSRELRAFLKEDEKGGSSLDHAFADGAVKIVDTTPLRTRTGTSEHAEYHVSEAKVAFKRRTTAARRLCQRHYARPAAYVFFRFRKADCRGRSNSAGGNPYIEKEVVRHTRCRSFRPVSYPKPIVAGGLWMTYRYRFSRVRLWACWDRTGPEKRLRFT